MHPSCSQYAKLALKNNRFDKAFYLISDRLNRCGNDLEHYKIASSGSQGLKYLDSDPSFNIEPVHSTWLYPKLQQVTGKIDSTDDSKKQYQLIKFLIQSDLVDHTHEAFRSLILKFPNSRYIDSLHFDYSSYYYQLGIIDKSSQHLTRLEGKISNESWYYLNALLNAKAYDYESMNHYTHLMEQGGLKKTFSDLEQEVNALKPKSPFFAGALSTLIPGSGYIISKKRNTALTAFVFNTFLGLATYESFKNESYILGSGLSVLSLGWYVGTVRGSIRAVHEYNKNQKLERTNKYLNKLKFKLL